MLLLLILLSGQTWAFYQAYQMTGQMDAMTVNTIQTDHDNSATNGMMHHSMNKQTADNSMECCQVSEECQCPANSCSTTQFLMTVLASTQLFQNSALEWSNFDGLFLHKPQSPLYRPPII